MFYYCKKLWFCDFEHDLTFGRFLVVSRHLMEIMFIILVSSLNYIIFNGINFQFCITKQLLLRIPSRFYIIWTTSVILVLFSINPLIPEFIYNYMIKKNNYWRFCFQAEGFLAAAWINMLWCKCEGVNDLLGTKMNSSLAIIMYIFLFRGTMIRTSHPSTHNDSHLKYSQWKKKKKSRYLSWLGCPTQ